MGTAVREDKIKRREGNEDTLSNDRNMGANKKKGRFCIFK